MSDNFKVSDIMTGSGLVSLAPEDSFEHAAKLFVKSNFNGFPVVDKDNELVGIVTAFEMVSQSSSYLNGSQKNYESLKEMKVQDIMNRDPLVISPDVGIENLAKEFAEHHRVNPIPVVDDGKKLIGVVSRYDIIKFFGGKYLNQTNSIGHEGVLRRLGRLDSEI